MIRVIQRRLIIPRGDTGTFTVPALSPGATGSVGVFTIFDPITKIRVFQKKVDLDGDVFNIEFGHGDTVNLQAGDYLWDIKFYKDPVIENGKVISGTEIDSYYAAFQTPKCEIRETGDDFMAIEGTPVKVEDLNIILAATQAANAARIAAEASATEAAEKLEQMVAAIPTKISDLVDDSGHYTKPAEGIPATDFDAGAQTAIRRAISAYQKPVNGIPTSDLEETYLTEHQDLSNYVQKTDYATSDNAGVMKVNSAALYGMFVDSTDHYLKMMPAASLIIKNGVEKYKAIAPFKQHESTFYGLAKAAGDTTQSQSSNAVGAYTDEAKAAIQQMLDVPSTADIPTNVSELTNDAGYLTQHQDISGKADKDEILFERGAGDGSVKIKDGYDSYGTLRISVANGMNGFSEGAVGTIVFLLTGEENATSYSLRMISNVSVELIPIGSKIFLTASGLPVGTGRSIVSIDKVNNTVTVSETFGEALLNRNASCYLNHGADGTHSHVEGYANAASGSFSHAEGSWTVASGTYSHSEGIHTQAIGVSTHTEGEYTIATGPNAHVSGAYNVDDGFSTIPEWAAGTTYVIGDMVKRTTVKTDGTTSTIVYKCKIENSDETFTKKNWTNNPRLNFVEIIGNGTTENTRSNAYALSWEGDGKYAGDVYINCNTDSSGGTKVLSVADFATDLDIQNIINGGAGA